VSDSQILNLMSCRVCARACDCVNVCVCVCVCVFPCHSFVLFLFITSAKQDVFSSLCVCLLATLRKTLEQTCMKFSDEVGNGPANK